MNISSSIDSLLKFTFCLHILSGFYYTFILTNYNYNYNLHSIVNPLFSVLSLGSINHFSLFFKERTSFHYCRNNGREIFGSYAPNNSDI